MSFLTDVKEYSQVGPIFLPTDTRESPWKTEKRCRGVSFAQGVKNL